MTSISQAGAPSSPRSTGGIGLALATGLAKADTRITLVGRTQERVDAALVRLREASGRDDAIRRGC